MLVEETGSCRGWDLGGGDGEAQAPLGAPTSSLEAEEWESHLAPGVGVELQFYFGHAGRPEAPLFPSEKWLSASQGHHEGFRR